MLVLDVEDNFLHHRSLLYNRVIRCFFVSDAGVAPVYFP